MIRLREAIGSVIDHNSIVEIWGPEKDENGATISAWKGMAHKIPAKYLDLVDWKVFGTMRDNPMDSDTVNIKIFETRIPDEELKRNAEHYVDPTAYKAIKKADKDAEHEKVRKLMGCIRRICELSGFSIVGRIELLDEHTGEIWK